MSADPCPPAPRPVALVTGSASGIGAGIARRLAADGYMVIVHSRASVDAGRALATSLGESACYRQADLTKDTDSRTLIAGIEREHGRLDLLVNNAGQSQAIAHDDLEAADADVWRRLYEINVIAPWRLITCAQALLRQASTAARPAHIINISSHAGSRPRGASIPYAASKAALDHMTRLLARSLAPAIRVNAIAPGLVDTPMTANWTDAQDLWREVAPMRRAARPADIADLVALLETSTYLTGQIIVADGGMHLNR